MEIWKDIHGYEGLYQVSNLGRIKSLDRIVLQKNNKNHSFKGKILKGRKNNGGYLLIGISKNSKRKMCTIHRLVAKTFINNFNNKLQVNHKNGVKTDNRVENLELLTHKKNTEHASKNNLMRKGKGHYLYGKYGKNSKFSIPIIMSDLNDNFIKKFDSMHCAGRFLIEQGIAKEPVSCISKVCKNKRNKAYGYKWRYSIEQT